MPIDDPWKTSVSELVRKAPHERAAHYREQATRLRELAEAETGQKLRQDLLSLADQYDALACGVPVQRLYATRYRRICGIRSGCSSGVKVVADVVVVLRYIEKLSPYFGMRRQLSRKAPSAGCLIAVITDVLHAGATSVLSAGFQP